MSDKTIAAMTLALEALENVDGLITALLGSLLGSPESDAPGAKVQTAIAALREALAEQRLTNMQQKMERSIESLEAALVQERAASNTKTELAHA